MITGNPATEPYLILAQELMRRIYADMEPDELHRWLMEQMAKIGATGGESAALLWLESFEYYDKLLEERAIRAAMPADQRRELTWAWQSWNQRIDPLEDGLLALIAAGDGVGKTIYAETQTEAWARNGIKVAFVHFELNRAIMLDRRAARHTGIARRELKAGPFSAELTRKWHEARARLGAWDGQITYWHTPGWSMDKVVQHLEREIAEEKCDVVVVDYLEKAQPSARQLKLFGANQYQREADDVEVVKTFAERSGAPVLLLAQMSKAGKGTNMSTLDRTAIRGAGEKTEKANIVVLLSRDRVDEGYAPVVDVRIDKNTLGPTGNFQQFMDGAHFRVYDLQEQQL